MPDDPLEQLRAICLTFPEATEKLAWDTIPTFRVREKIFAQYERNHHSVGRSALWCKAPPGIQGMLVGSNPERFFVPPYVGHHGWVGVWLDGVVDWGEVADLVDESYRMTVPKRLLVLLAQPKGD
ncbi:MAG: MmcQ/YjbR family DNA-binding protein [Chloroflexota bacterium]|nr:MmcQ/YjbR family DNA-binding protein [Chloroflexota bacterium]